MILSTIITSFLYALHLNQLPGECIHHTDSIESCKAKAKGKSSEQSGHTPPLCLWASQMDTDVISLVAPTDRGWLGVVSELSAVSKWQYRTGSKRYFEKV